MHFQIEMWKKNLGISEIKMQQSVPMGQISEINMQQTFHVLQYIQGMLDRCCWIDKSGIYGWRPGRLLIDILRIGKPI